MNRSSFRAKTIALCCSILLIPLVFLLHLTHAQTPPKKIAEHSNVQLELVRTETGFFEAWKTKDEAYFRAHMPEEGIFWGESG
ncbi:MAG: hypothetical protein ACLPH3_16180, partial [Terracidiphilus sp.]